MKKSRMPVTSECMFKSRCDDYMTGVYACNHDTNDNRFSQCDSFQKFSYKSKVDMKKYQK